MTWLDFDIHAVICHLTEELTNAAMSSNPECVLTMILTHGLTESVGTQV